MIEWSVLSAGLRSRAMAVQNAVPGGHGEREDRTSSKT